MCAAYLHLGWLAAFGTPLWGATAVAVLLALAIFRWV
jgi:predicted small integral membrane protein